MSEYDINAVAEQIKTLFIFSSSIPEDAVERTIDSIDNKVSGSVLFMAMGQDIDFDGLAKKKKRAEALLNLIRVLKETENE